MHHPCQTKITLLGINQPLWNLLPIIIAHEIDWQVTDTWQMQQHRKKTIPSILATMICSNSDTSSSNRYCCLDYSFYLWNNVLLLRSFVQTLTQKQVLDAFYNLAGVHCMSEQISMFILPHTFVQTSVWHGRCMKIIYVSPANRRDPPPTPKKSSTGPQQETILSLLSNWFCHLEFSLF